jgi:ribose transport system substrate-binding protein
MKYRVSLLALLLICLASVGIGCRDPKTPTGKDGVPKGNTDKPKVAFVSNNAYQFWTFAQKGAEKAAAEFDVELEFKKPQDSSVEVQQEIINTLINRGFKGIAVSPNEPKNTLSYFKTKVNPNVVLVMTDNDLPDETARRCYIGTHNDRAGRGAGELVKKAFPKGGKIAIFVGQIDSTNAVERRQGVLDVLAGKDQKDIGKLTPPDAANFDIGNHYTLITTKVDGGDVKNCQAQAEDLLIKHSDIDCMIGLWEYNPPAMLRAVKGSTNKVKPLIVAFDENPDTLKGIRSGEVVGTIAQDPYQFGYQSIKVLSSLTRGKDDVLKTWPNITSNGSIFVEHQTITRDTIDAFEKRVKEILGN